MTYRGMRGGNLRARLLAGCALSGALAVLDQGINPTWAMGGPAVPVGCVAPSDGSFGADCSGDLSTGVPFIVTFPLDPEFKLKIFDVKGEIAPKELPGILTFYPDGDVMINSDLGNNRIVTRNGIPGILAQGRNVWINHKGDIEASGYGSFGILALAQDCGCEEDPLGPPGVPASKPALYETLTLVSSANITAGSHGAAIFAMAGSGASVTSTGDIRAGYRSSGIIAVSGGPDSMFGYFSLGDVSVVSNGNINLDDHGPRDGVGLPDLEDFSPPWDAGILAFNGAMGSVKVISHGNITTDGNDRHGILALADGFSPDETVEVNSTGNIDTTGAGSSGIFAGSIYADVSVASKGNITTRGQFADGIHAESQFGGGVSVTSDGNIDASGNGSYGIFVAGYSDLSVTINSATVSGGSGDGGSVAFFAGLNNTLVNRGTITGGRSGWAVEGDTLGAETVDNHGIISGNVELALDPDEDWSGVRAKKAAPHSETVTTDSFRNRAGAAFNSGEFVQLGNAGLLLNEGTINPGGAGVVATTNLDGRLQQTRSGVLRIDIDGNKADHVIISTPIAAAVASANLSGKITPALVSFDASSATQRFTIISANAEIIDAGVSVTDTALVDYDLLYPNANEVVLSLHADFSGTGLTPNQNSLVSYLGRLIGSPSAQQFEDIFVAFLSAPDQESVAQLANQMLTSAGNSALTAMFVSEAFANAMRSCAVAGGSHSQLRETSCVWAKPFAREFSQNAGVGRADIDGNTAGFAGGAQVQVNEKVFAGAGFSIEESNSAVDVTSRQDGTWWQFGGVLKYVDGPLKLSASVNGGQGDLDMTRQAGIGASVAAESGTDISFVTNLARLAYSFGETGFYVTPMVDMGATYLQMDGFTESGAGIFNLAVASSDQWIFFGGPAVEIGATIAQADFELRPYIKAGVTFLSEDSFDIEARFAAASPGVAPFRVTSNFDDTFATLDAGVQLFSTDGLNLRLSYQGKFGEDSHVNGVDAKLSINY